LGPEDDKPKGTPGLHGGTFWILIVFLLVFVPSMLAQDRTAATDHVFPQFADV
jgi:hypothetical protein